MRIATRGGEIPASFALSPVADAASFFDSRVGIMHHNLVSGQNILSAFSLQPSA